MINFNAYKLMSTNQIKKQNNQNSHEIDSSSIDSRFYNLNESDLDNFDEISDFNFINDNNKEKEESEEENKPENIKDILNFLEVHINFLIQKSELPQKFKKLKIILPKVLFSNLLENYLNFNVYELFASNIFKLEDKECIERNKEIIDSISIYIKNNLQTKVSETLKNILDFFEMNLNQLFITYNQEKGNNEEKSSSIDFLRRKRKNPIETIEVNKNYFI